MKSNHFARRNMSFSRAQHFAGSPVTLLTKRAFSQPELPECTQFSSDLDPIQPNTRSCKRKHKRKCKPPAKWPNRNVHRASSMTSIGFDDELPKLEGRVKGQKLGQLFPKRTASSVIHLRSQPPAKLDFGVHKKSRCSVQKLAHQSRAFSPKSSSCSAEVERQLPAWAYRTPDRPPRKRAPECPKLKRIKRRIHDWRGIASVRRMLFADARSQGSAATLKKTFGQSKLELDGLTVGRDPDNSTDETVKLDLFSAQTGNGCEKCSSKTSTGHRIYNPNRVSYLLASPFGETGQDTSRANGRVCAGLGESGDGALPGKPKRILKVVSFDGFASAEKKQTSGNVSIGGAKAKSII